MRSEFAWLLPAHDAVHEIGRHAAELMILSVEIGLVHREGVYQMLDLVVGIGTEHGKIRLKRLRFRGDNSLGEPTIDVVALVIVERHASPPIEKLAEPPYVLQCHVDGTGSQRVPNSPFQ